MAGSRSIPGLVKAFQGYQAEHGSSPEHQSSIEVIGNAIRQMQGGGEPPSPGARAAHNAAMGAEVSHGGGDGQKRSNEPAPPAPEHEQVPDIHGSSESSDHMKGTSPRPSAGHMHSALRGGMAGGTSQVRRIAAEREMSRRDAKFKPLSKAPENNKASNPKGEGYPPAGRMGEATSTPKALGSPGSPAPSENTPARLGGQQRNPFARAGEQARERFRQRK